VPIDSINPIRAKEQKSRRQLEPTTDDMHELFQADQRFSLTCCRTRIGASRAAARWGSSAAWRAASSI
jgi:hypothetical protein